MPIEPLSKLVDLGDYDYQGNGNISEKFIYFPLEDEPKIIKWDLYSDNKVWEREIEQLGTSDYEAIQISPDESLIAICQGSNLYVYDQDQDQVIFESDIATWFNNGLAFPDNETLLMMEYSDDELLEIDLTNNTVETIASIGGNWRVENAGGQWVRQENKWYLCTNNKVVIYDHNEKEVTEINNVIENINDQLFDIQRDLRNNNIVICDESHFYIYNLKTNEITDEFDTEYLDGLFFIKLTPNGYLLTVEAEYYLNQANDTSHIRDIDKMELVHEFSGELHIDICHMNESKTAFILGRKGDQRLKAWNIAEWYLNLTDRRLIKDYPEIKGERLDQYIVMKLNRVLIDTTTEIMQVGFVNLTGYPVENVQITVENFADGVNAELSKSKDPFEEDQQQITFNDVFDHLEEKEFYIRMTSDEDQGAEISENDFEFKINADFHEE